MLYGDNKLILQELPIELLQYMRISSQFWLLITFCFSDPAAQKLERMLNFNIEDYVTKEALNVLSKRVEIYYL